MKSSPHIEHFLVIEHAKHIPLTNPNESFPHFGHFLVIDLVTKSSKLPIVVTKLWAPDVNGLDEPEADLVAG